MSTNLRAEPGRPFISIPSEGSEVWAHSRKQFTSVAAADGVVVGGGFFGEYAYKSESIDDSESTSNVTDHQEGLVVGPDVQDGIINHVHLYTPRSTSNPTATFCTNNHLIRYLDCNSNTFIKEHGYGFPINGCATSPDQRIRVLVGDSLQPIVTEVESGNIITHLTGHGDNCFASAWADDGVTFATGSQDKTVFIWDARNWRQSMYEINTVMAAPRSLTFSRLGSGRRHLIVAEATDRVHIVNCRDYSIEHALDSFGEIGGVAISPSGGRLFVANTDEHFGGLLVYDRLELALPERNFIRSEDGTIHTEARGAYTGSDARKPVDWLPEGETWGPPRPRILSQRRTAGEVDAGEMMLPTWLI
jgi:WD40 repeat protein